MSQKEAAMFDHANVNKTGAWEEFEKQLRSAMETKSVESQVRVKPTLGRAAVAAYVDAQDEKHKQLQETRAR